MTVPRCSAMSWFALWLPPSSRRNAGVAHRLVLLLAACRVACYNASNNDDEYIQAGQDQDEELGSVSDLAPSAIHWALAVILGVALFGGLIRVVRVLQKDGGISPMRHAPEGMRPVQCGACHAMQHVTMHGRIFICFSCHSANRIAMDPAGNDEPQLVAATGPLRRFEFRREGENFFQETHRLEIEDAEAAQLIATAVPSPGTGNASANSSTADAPAREGNVVSNPGDVEAGANSVSPDATGPTPHIVGHVDSELISNHSVCSKGSKKSKQSRFSRMSANGLPTCVVCLEDPGNMVMLPCAHGGVCDGCITRIAQNRASGGAHCPHCRSVIETLVKIHEVEGSSVKGVEFRIPIARTL